MNKINKYKYFDRSKEAIDYDEIVSVLKSKSFDAFIKYAKENPDNFFIQKENQDFLKVYKFLGAAYAREIASKIAMKLYLSLDRETLDFYYAELRKYAGR